MEEGVFRQSMKLMGNHFELSVVGSDEAWASDCINAGVREIQRIEHLLTTFSEDSETARINANAGAAPVEVSPETFALIERSIRISNLTQGAFDITYGSVDKSLWNFDTMMKRLPDASVARERVSLIDYRKILLDPQKHSVLLKEKGMRIGFGGIGKGYAAEKAKDVMKKMGVKSGVVNASGDLTAWGYQPGGQPWTIGIVNPNAAGKVFSHLNVTGHGRPYLGVTMKNLSSSTANGIRIRSIRIRDFLPTGAKSVAIRN